MATARVRAVRRWRGERAAPVLGRPPRRRASRRGDAPQARRPGEALLAPDEQWQECGGDEQPAERVSSRPGPTSKRSSAPQLGLALDGTRQAERCRGRTCRRGVSRSPTARGGRRPPPAPPASPRACAASRATADAERACCHAKGGEDEGRCEGRGEGEGGTAATARTRISHRACCASWSPGSAGERGELGGTRQPARSHGAAA